MSIVTTDIWAAWSNLDPDVSPGERRSIDQICRQVDRSIKNRVKRTLEQQTFSNLIVDAPETPNILLGRYAPITISTLLVWKNDQAQGNPSFFNDTTDLLGMYSDYAPDTDPDDPLLSPGNLRRVNGIWGISYRRRPNQLAFNLDPNYGAIKMSFTGGYATIPDDIIEAACITISKVLGVRKYGMQVGSESWNGYSYNLPGVGMMINGLLGNPDIRGLIEPYTEYANLIG